MMKKALSAAICLLLSIPQLCAQNKCGMQLVIDQMIQQEPGYKHAIAAFKNSQAEQATRYNNLLHSGATLKTTTSNVIPVVFHIILDSAQVNSIGGVEGIESRLSSQMNVLNADFGGNNADASKVPDVWTAHFAHTGIRFGRAKTDPAGNPTEGYELRYVPSTSSFAIDSFIKTAKSYSRGGLNSWDYTRYLNIWIVNIRPSGAGQILGLTVMPNMTGTTTADRGIVLNYLAFGQRIHATDKFISGSDMGRTLTHEMGHYFSLWHTWGDDGGLCPGDPGGDDDGIADTPPQADQTFGKHTFPLYDACSPSGSSDGIMFMNYMDYSDDICLYMFTRDQSIRMNAEIASGGASQSLTQHPELTGDTTLGEGVDVKVGPVPSTGIINISFNRDIDLLQSVRVTDLNGRTVFSLSDQPSITQLDLGGQPKGMYFLELHFSRTTVIRKLMLW